MIDRVTFTGTVCNADVVHKGNYATVVFNLENGGVFQSVHAKGKLAQWCRESLNNGMKVKVIGEMCNDDGLYINPYKIEEVKKLLTLGRVYNAVGMLCCLAVLTAFFVR